MIATSYKNNITGIMVAITGSPGSCLYGIIPMLTTTVLQDHFHLTLLFTHTKRKLS